MPYAAALVLVALYAILGPLRFHQIHLPFSTSQWVTLFHHPGLDDPYEATPEIYSELSASPGPLTIVEYPYYSPVVLLYRNYALQHGHEALAGYMDGDGMLSRKPYARLTRESLPESGMDWLILHLDLHRELAHYAQSVGLKIEARSWVPLAESLDRIEKAWGTPDYRDEWVAAWHVSGRR